MRKLYNFSLFMTLLTCSVNLNATTDNVDIKIDYSEKEANQAAALGYAKDMMTSIVSFDKNQIIVTDPSKVLENIATATATLGIELLMHNVDNQIVSEIAEVSLITYDISTCVLAASPANCMALANRAMSTVVEELIEAKRMNAFKAQLHEAEYKLWYKYVKDEFYTYNKVHEGEEYISPDQVFWKYKTWVEKSDDEDCLLKDNLEAGLLRAKRMEYCALNATFYDSVLDTCIQGKSVFNHQSIANISGYALAENPPENTQVSQNLPNFLTEFNTTDIPIDENYNRYVYKMQRIKEEMSRQINNALSFPDLNDSSSCQTHSVANFQMHGAVNFCKEEHFTKQLPFMSFNPVPVNTNPAYATGTISTLVNSADTTVPELTNIDTSSNNRFADMTDLYNYENELNSNIQNLDTAMSVFEEAELDFNTKAQAYVDQLDKVKNNLSNFDEVDIQDIGKIILTNEGEIITSLGEVFNLNGEKLDKVVDISNAVGTAMDLYDIYKNFSNDEQFMSDFQKGKIANKAEMLVINALQKEGMDLFKKVFDDTPGSMLSKNKEKAALVDFAVEMSASGMDYQKAGEGVSLAMNAFDIGSPKDRKRVTKIVNYGVQVAGAIAMAYTGNPMGAMSLVGSAFGMGGDSGEPDPQVMASLEAIHEKLDNIIGKLNVMQDTLNEINIKIDTVILKLDGISEDIDNQTEILLAELNLIKTRINVSIKLILDTSDLGTSSKMCESFLDSRSSIDIDYTYNYSPFKVGFYSSYKDFVYDINTYSQESNFWTTYHECNNVFDSLFTGPSPTNLKDINSLLLVSSYEHITDAEKYQENVNHYKKLQDLFTDHYGDNDHLFLNLINPVQYNSRLTTIPFNSSNYYDIAKIDYKYLGIDSYDMIEPIMMEYYVNMLMEILPLKGLLNADIQDFLTIDEIKSKTTSLNTYNYLYHALRLINVAIAQQNILHGHSLIPTVHKKLFSKRVSLNTKVDLLDALNNNITGDLRNNLFARNYLIYQIHQELQHARKDSNNPESYVDTFQKNLNCYEKLLLGNSDETCTSLNKLLITKWDRLVDGTVITKSSLEDKDSNGILDSIVIDYKSGGNTKSLVMRLPYPKEIKANAYHQYGDLLKLASLRERFYNFVANQYDDVTVFDLYNINVDYKPVSLMSSKYISYKDGIINITKSGYDFIGYKKSLIEGIDSSNVVISIVDTPKHGTIFDEENTIKYIPNSNFTGDDNITVSISDGIHTSYQAITFHIYDIPNPIPSLTYDDKENFVKRVFLLVHNREPDASELTYWTNILNTRSVEYFMEQLTNSPEVVNRNLSDLQYIYFMYAALFDREPTQNEIDDWIMKLSNTFSREMMLNTLMNSDEFSTQKYLVTDINYGFNPAIINYLLW